MCILMFANEAFGRSEMPTVSHLAHSLRLSASVHGSWCRVPPGRSSQSPRPYATQRMSIRFASESKAKANENERQRMHTIRV